MKDNTNKKLKIKSSKPKTENNKSTNNKKVNSKSDSLVSDRIKKVRQLYNDQGQIADVIFTTKNGNQGLLDEYTTKQKDIDYNNLASKAEHSLRDNKHPHIKLITYLLIASISLLSLAYYLN